MSIPWRRRTKRIGYRDQGNSSLATHQAHWAGFTWEAGSVIVAYIGAWGTVQVWAATEAEGRRVVGHACAVAAIPTSGASVGEWVVATTDDQRNGKPGTFGTAIVQGLPVVTKRNGPSGSALLDE